MKTGMLACLGLLAGFLIVFLVMMGSGRVATEPTAPAEAELADTTGPRTPPAAAAAGDDATAYRALAVEQDTLIRTLQTAMQLLQELGDVEQEIVGGPAIDARETAVPWDERVRTHLDRLRERYQELETGLRRAEARLAELDRGDERLRASLQEALAAADALREDNQRQQARISELTAHVQTLLQERDVAVALSAARADTIRQLDTSANTVYWIAGTEQELIDKGLVEKTGGASLLFARVGETLVARRGLDPEQFHRVDRRETRVIDLPDAARYEIVTKQDIAHLADGSGVRDGGRWYVRERFEIADPSFWDPAKFLILVRR